jgi:hypothetical protein
LKKAINQRGAGRDWPGLKTRKRCQSTALGGSYLHKEREKEGVGGLALSLMDRGREGIRMVVELILITHLIVTLTGMLTIL